MSDVRLSNSPTLERVDVRLSDHPKSRACRCLFGPTDHGDLKKEHQEFQRLQEEAAAQKWNFDFARDQPLEPGNYDWTAVDGGDMPDFYRRGHHATRPALPSASAAAVDLGASRDCRAKSEARGSEEAADEPDGLTDYKSPCEKSAHRKRSGNNESSSRSKRSRTLLEDSSQCSVLTRSVEVTPKKSKT